MSGGGRHITDLEPLEGEEFIFTLPGAGAHGRLLNQGELERNYVALLLLNQSCWSNSNNLNQPRTPNSDAAPGRMQVKAPPGGIPRFLDLSRRAKPNFAMLGAAGLLRSPAKAHSSASKTPGRPVLGARDPNSFRTPRPDQTDPDSEPEVSRPTSGWVWVSLICVFRSHRARPVGQMRMTLLAPEEASIARTA
jgi:hypothetical protein